MKKKRKVKDYAEIPYTSLRKVYRFFWWSGQSLRTDLKEILEDVSYGVVVEVLDKVDRKLLKMKLAYDALWSTPIAKREKELEEVLTKAGFCEDDDDDDD